MAFGLPSHEDPQQSRVVCQWQQQEHSTGLTNRHALAYMLQIFLYTALQQEQRALMS